MIYYNNYYMSKYYSKQKYWNSFVTPSKDLSLNHDIINEIESNCKYDILDIGNDGKVKRMKKLSVKNRELYTRFKLNQELPYLKKYKHLISVNPPGKKYLLYIKHFSNKNQVIFINRYKEKHLNYEHQVLKVDMEFKSSLFKGTLIDGQAVKKKDGKWYFVADDIYMYEGYNIMNNSFLERFEILKNIFRDSIFTKIENDYLDIYENESNNVIYFELKFYTEYKHAIDLCTNYYRYFNYFDNNEKFQNKVFNEDNYNGDIPKGIIFTNIDLNATKIYYVLPINELNIEKKETVQLEEITNKHMFFKMKKHKISDVYNLYCINNTININYGFALIDTLRRSETFNSYFKKRVINFNNIDDNYENEEIIVKCSFNNKFNKWLPLTKEPIDTLISNEADIKNIENKFQMSNISTNITSNYNIPTYNKNNYLLFNEHNITLDIKYIESLLKKYGLEHDIQNDAIFQTAFIHKSYSKNFYIKEYNKDKSGKNLISCKVAYNLITNDEKDNKKDCLDLFENSNERLEWFGDSKLADIISTYLEQRFPNEEEGFLTVLRSKLVRKNTLYELGKILNFQKYIVMAKNIEYYEDGRNSPDIIEDCFEAFIGALYKELSQNKCEYKLKYFIINLYETELDIVDIILNDDNYKTKLMIHYNKMNNKNPIYKVNEEINENGTERIYNVRVCEPINQEVIGHGSDKLRKKAEQNAAKSALTHLQLLD